MYFTVQGETVGDFKVSLNKYHIVVQGDVLLVVYSRMVNTENKFDKYKYGRLYVLETMVGGKCLRRDVSLDNREKLKDAGCFSPCLWLIVAY